jgi:putative addiction module component (TIGR02574 family)
MIKMQEILEMSVAERILIIEKIWDNIDHDDIAISETHQQEPERRLDRYTKGQTTFVSWDSIKKELNTA